MNASLIIATRESRLALWQAHHVKQRLEQQGLGITLLGMTTQGDQILNQPLSQIGGKGLFIKELEVAMAKGEAHLAVHSMKDVPMELPEGFELACILEREDPRDAWVSTQYESLEALPKGAVVGTSSLRRTVLLAAMRPDLRTEPLRGNLDTRLKKLDSGHYAGIVLASAGLKRLGLSDRIRKTFSLTEMIPAAGQGAIGIEICSSRRDLLGALTPLNDVKTALEVYAERGVSRTMGGSCSMPLAAHALWGENTLHLSASWGDPLLNGSELIKAEAKRIFDLSAPDLLSQASQFGAEVANRLIEKGAVPIVKSGG